MSSSARTAVVTGSSSGIGLDIARALLERGWNVILNGRDTRRLTAAAERLGDANRCAAVAGSIEDRNTSKEMVRVARERFGRIDALVNNAGLFALTPFLEVTEEELDRFVDINLKGTYLTTQTIARSMREDGRGGVIVNIGTVLVEHAMQGVPASAPLVAKGGVHALTHLLAAELAADGIRVNAVAPGFIDTPLLDGADRRWLAAAALMNRMGNVSDTTAAVLFLLDAPYITGHILNVDGGYVTARRQAHAA